MRLKKRLKLQQIEGTDRAVSILSPGVHVINPDQPDWGMGQVQSVTGQRVTVNFEEMGKLTINIAIVNLVVVDPEDLHSHR